MLSFQNRFLSARKEVIEGIVEEMGYEGALAWSKKGSNVEIVNNICMDLAKISTRRDLAVENFRRKTRIVHTKTKNRQMENFSLI